VFERELRRFRQAVRAEDFEIRDHALEEMEADGFSVLDLESCVLMGEIVERQRDRQTGEWKFIIEGPAVDGLGMIVVAKWIAMGRMGS
jgi:hypothetical protein